MKSVRLLFEAADLATVRLGHVDPWIETIEASHRRPGRADLLWSRWACASSTALGASLRPTLSALRSPLVQVASMSIEQRVRPATIKDDMRSMLDRSTDYWDLEMKRLEQWSGGPLRVRSDAVPELQRRTAGCDRAILCFGRVAVLVSRCSGH